MKSLVHKLVLVLICALPLAGGCGGGGTPGTIDSLETGVFINSTLLEIIDDDKEPNRGEIDVAIHRCPDGTTVEKGLFMAAADLKIAASRMNPDISYDPLPASIEKCTITYFKGNSDTASPVIEQMVTYPNCTIIDGTSTCPTVLMDIQRKIEWWVDVTSGANLPAEYPTHYVARMQCDYVTKYGKRGSFQHEADIWMADWNRCE